jgi:ERCC4-related helicase
MTELRTYQKAVISECKRVIANGQRRVMIVAPTGAGKTVIGDHQDRRRLRETRPSARPHAVNHQANFPETSEPRDSSE